MLAPGGYIPAHQQRHRLAAAAAATAAAIGAFLQRWRHELSKRMAVPHAVLTPFCSLLRPSAAVSNSGSGGAAVGFQAAKQALELLRQRRRQAKGGAEGARGGAGLRGEGREGAAPSRGIQFPACQEAGVHAYVIGRKNRADRTTQKDLVQHPPGQRLLRAEGIRSRRGRWTARSHRSAAGRRWCSNVAATVSLGVPDAWLAEPSHGPSHGRGAPAAGSGALGLAESCRGGNPAPPPPRELRAATALSPLPGPRPPQTGW